MAAHQHARRRTPLGRYGPTRGRRAPAWVRYLLLATGVAVGIAIAVVLDLRNTSPVEAGVRGFTPVSAHAVQIVFDVRKPASATAQCVLRARDADGAEVGRATTTVPSRRDGNEVTTVTYLLATTARAVTGEVASCAITKGG